LTEDQELKRTEQRLTEDQELKRTEQRLTEDQELKRTEQRLTENRELMRTEQRLSKGLRKLHSGLDELPDAWLHHVAPQARMMRYVTVDGSELTKAYGGMFEYLAYVRDGSAPGKPIKPGYWTVNIEANDGQGHHLPLALDVFSTEDPDYVEKGEEAWRLTFEAEIRRVEPFVNDDATWLLDRGFDDNDVIDGFENKLRKKLVIRLKKNRNILVGDVSNPTVRNIAQFALALKKPHTVHIPYIDKRTHRRKTYPHSFTYVPIRLPKVRGAYYLIVVTGVLGEDWLLLTNRRPRNPEQAAALIRAYVARWGTEEMTRFWKQCTDAEDFRVQSLRAIRRLLFLAMIAIGIQSLWALRCPKLAKRLIARVQYFIENVQFQYYRLWAGTADALLFSD
jgi:Transposase DDE domain